MTTKEAILPRERPLPEVPAGRAGRTGRAALPREFRQKVPSGALFFRTGETLAGLSLHTVCEEAKCPNRVDCFSRGTLAFQILGDVCTRRCGFCAEKTGRPLPVDWEEPHRILAAARRLRLSHVVLTAPARDDLDDGGAALFAAAVSLLKKEMPGTRVEVLISDLNGDEQAVLEVLKSGPDVFNHNLETVERLTPAVRAKAAYARSLAVLKFASQRIRGGRIKSGVMVGLGETMKELQQAFFDLAHAGVQYVTIGQYLQPSPAHLPMAKIYSGEEMREVERLATLFDFEKVFCGPLVRSSFHAAEMAAFERREAALWERRA